VSRVTRPAVILAAAVACALLFSGAANAAALPHYGPTTCKGGKIRSGSYASLRITVSARLATVPTRSCAATSWSATTVS